MSNPHRIRLRAKRRKRSRRFRNSKAHTFLRLAWRFVNGHDSIDEYRGFTWISNDELSS